MLTVAELAKELGVSAQTIYRVLNSVKQHEKERLTEKIKGVGYFTALGERMVRERLAGVKQKSEECLTVFNTVKHSEDDEILFLREQNKALFSELEMEREHSRNQANRIADLADQLAELTRNGQVLLKQEQEKNLQTLTAKHSPVGDAVIEVPKKSFFKRLFSKDKKQKSKA